MQLTEDVVMVKRKLVNKKSISQDTAVIMWSSGTTGDPKAIKVLHNRLITEVEYEKKEDDHKRTGPVMVISFMWRSSRPLRTFLACFVLNKTIIYVDPLAKSTPSRILQVLKSYFGF